MTKFKKFSLLIILFLFVVACNDDTTIFDAKTDAYILKRASDGQQKFAMGYFVYANRAIRSAVVNTPTNEVITLSENPNNSFIFLQEPLLNDFSMGIPILGEYLFEVHSAEDELFQATDQLTYNNLPIPEITGAEYNKDSKILKVEWDPAANADGYAVKVTQTTGTIVFVSFSLDRDATAYEITSAHGNWITPPAMGRNYLLEVHAFAYEEGVDYEDQVYNLNEIAIGSREIVWGQ